MIVAVDKYTTFSSVPTVQVIDIADAKLPDIYICSKDLDLEKHGYIYGLSGFLEGNLNGFKENTSFITWEGANNVSYEEITGENHNNSLN